MTTLSSRVRALMACAVLLAVVPVFAGCDLAADGSPGLDGTSWRAIEWADAGTDPAEWEITAIFSEDEVGGRSAVNTYSGPYRATRGGEFSVGILVQTLMAGPEPAMRAESTYLGLLARATGYERDGDELILLDEDDALLIRFVRAE